MKYRTTPECPAVGARMITIFEAIASTITEEHVASWDDAVELSAYTAVLVQLWCCVKDIEPESDLVNGLGHAIAQTMHDYTKEYQNAPRN